MQFFRLLNESVSLRFWSAYFDHSDRTPQTADAQTRITQTLASVQAAYRCSAHTTNPSVRKRTLADLPPRHMGQALQGERHGQG